MGKTNTISISKSRLLQNITTIRKKISSKKLCAVVKANAYGLGCENIVPIIDPLVDYYAVANLNEAVILRDLGVTKNILVLGVTQYSDFDRARKYNIELSIPSANYLHFSTNFDSLNFHLQLNTGLNRFGIQPKEVDYIFKFARQHNINIVGIYTHFATTSNDEEYIDTQYKFFQDSTKNISKIITKHCSNTYASLHKNYDEDMVRVGFGLYGSSNDGLSPIVSINAKIINILTLQKDDTLGYDRTFIAHHHTKVAVVSMGYADGLSRMLSNNFRLYIKNKYAPIIGLICMDVCFVEVTEINVHLFDDVEILGDHITLQDYATALHTSPYEILLNLGHARADTILKE